jgi:hypothetical protein
MNAVGRRDLGGVSMLSFCPRTFANVGYGTKRPSQNVRYSVAIEGKADLHGPS